MGDRTFRFRLHSSHQAPDRATSSDWIVIVSAVDGTFRIRLDPSADAEERQRADAEAIADLQERMTLCPISRNLPEGVQKRIVLQEIGPAAS